MCISLCVRRERVIAIVLLRVIGSCSVLCDTVFNRLQQLRDRFLGLTEQIAFTACTHRPHSFVHTSLESTMSNVYHGTMTRYLT